MKRHLIIDLDCLPEEGQAFTGDLDPAIFDLPEGDAIPTSPLRYDLWAQRFGDELLLLGAIQATFEFTCVRTLQQFEQTISLENAAIAIEIENRVQIEIGEFIREELLINFPANPNCENADEPMDCEIDSRYLALDKTPEAGVETAPHVAADDRWSALDNLTDLTDSP